MLGFQSANRRRKLLQPMLALSAAMALANGPSSAFAAPGADEASVWSGVYTEGQAQGGKKVHAALCAQCHGIRLDGANQSDMPQAPRIAGKAFLAKWEHQLLASLIQFTKATMPPMNRGSLTDQQYVESIAYMLKLSGIPSGDRELSLASAQLITIAKMPAAQQ